MKGLALGQGRGHHNRPNGGINRILSDDVVDFLCDYMPVAQNIRYALHVIGIRRQTYERWMKQGKIDQDSGRDTIYSSFYHRLRYATCVYELEHMLAHGSDFEREIYAYCAGTWPDIMCAVHKPETIEEMLMGMVDEKG